ncbi:hypothetical protein [Aquisalimonas sp.]|uniref:hypothetical protein n=1 Tax=Aquisalimonas sp. TaxID=1872621 RepID=UPI0025B7D5C5|nr:hypothetical protein [Aquisalimonas sp.]
MAPIQDTGPGVSSVLLFLLGLLLIASPFSAWWMSIGAPWYTAWVLWGLLIGLSVLLSLRLGHYDT